MGNAVSEMNCRFAFSLDWVEIEGDFQHLRGECWLEKRNEYTGKEKQLFTLFTNRLSDVTLLSLVLVENILFDAACGLLISPRNEGIRYSGTEKTQKDG